MSRPTEMHIENGIEPAQVGRDILSRSDHLTGNMIRVNHCVESFTMEASVI
jgi:hypothetical protein